MLTIHSPRHALRDAKTELSGGQLVRPFECPERVAFILERIAATGLGPVEEPREFGLDPILKVHDADYAAFLATAWDEWAATGAKGEAVPIVWPARRMVQRVPQTIGGKLGYYALGCDTLISPGTYEAALSSVDVALEGASRLAGGARGVFGLCRPPGHHAARDMYGGYCFFNNAAVAAQWLRDAGAGKVAVLDVDFHHGNGTQDIFYERADVLFLSIHGDPAHNFPYFLGYADETGAGAGEGFNVNLPLPRGTGWEAFRTALATALARITAFGAEALVVSLGVDTFAGDPISFFTLASDDFTLMGEMLGAPRLPTLFLMEGGYAVAEIGVNAVNVLIGFEAG